MLIRTLLALTLSSILVTLSAAGSLRILPDEIPLSGPNAQQRVLVVIEEDGKVVADRTAAAKFAPSDAKIIAVDRAGVVLGLADGEATLTATVDGQQATAKVKVSRSQQATPPSFRNEVIPVFTKVTCNSGACHGALAGKGGLKLSLRGYDPDMDHFVLTRQALGRRVDGEQPAQSLMLLKPTNKIKHGGGRRLLVESTDWRILHDWIAAGAPGPRDDDPRVERLEVFPPAATLKPGDHLQMVVRARYSDGRVRDVTPWVKFSSSEDLVAAVNADGKVTVAGHGEAAITVLFSNLVGFSRIASPLPHAIDAKVFAGARRANFIDDLVLKKLQALRIAPSPDCSDDEFIRRASLDAIGTLPTPEEVTRFLADKRADKRARLIDDLLTRPEFVDYWAYKWSDVLLVSSRKLSSAGMWAFYQFIRQSVADNQPWDQFARAIVTAQGSTSQNGAANYFVLHKDVSELTESTSVTFLGMSITCCRCHNHPLEKWTQDQYWSMANLFSRVALKNGDRPGEVVVQSQPAGDIAHPRRGVAMPPTPLDAKPLALDSSTDRRQYFADWLTAPENPYFAKALVNRVWRNFLGRGLVEAEDDMRQTNPPTNEELFDALAQDFVKHKYDVKRLIRTIMNSATYQRSSKPLKENASDDRFYSRYLIRRLPAEVILDAYSQVSGVPTAFTQVNVGASGGTASTSFYPSGTRALQLPDSLLVSPFLESFGRPDRIQTCACEREQDSSVGQALHLNNGKTLNEKLRDPKSRVEVWMKEKLTDEEAVRRVFLMALSREPTASELKRLTAILADAAADQTTTRREALEDLFWGVLTGKEFLFNR